MFCKVYLLQINRILNFCMKGCLRVGKTAVLRDEKCIEVAENECVNAKKMMFWKVENRENLAIKRLVFAILHDEKWRKRPRKIHRGMRFWGWFTFSEHSYRICKRAQYDCYFIWGSMCRWCVMMSFRLRGCSVVICLAMLLVCISSVVVLWFLLCRGYCLRCCIFVPKLLRSDASVCVGQVLWSSSVMLQ